MRHFPFALTATVLLSFASFGASAQTPAVETTPIPAAAKPDFSKMFLGTWRCSTKSSRRAWSFATTSTASVSPDGYWLITHTAIAKTPVNSAFHATDKLTYDPSTKRLVDIQTDEQGNYDVTTSPGWHGNTIVWSDVFAPKSGGIASTNPTTITRVSATRYTSLDTFVEPGGRVITVKAVCTKRRRVV
jgi:hypothetical protein